MGIRDKVCIWRGRGRDDTSGNDVGGGRGWGFNVEFARLQKKAGWEVGVGIFWLAAQMPGLEEVRQVVKALQAGPVATSGMSRESPVPNVLALAPFFSLVVVWMREGRWIFNFVFILADILVLPDCQSPNAGRGEESGRGRGTAEYEGL